VVTEKTPFPGGVIGINSFGFGGSNTHVVLRAPPTAPKHVKHSPVAFPRLVVYSGRTVESVHSLIARIVPHLDDVHLLQLLANQANLPSKDTPFRGVIVSNRDQGQAPIIDVAKVPITEARPIWFVYSGMGSQWPGMCRSLFAIPAFDESVRISSAAIETVAPKINVYNMLHSNDPELYKSNTLNSMLAITAIHVGICITRHRVASRLMQCRMGTSTMSHYDIVLRNRVASRHCITKSYCDIVLQNRVAS
jgi:fatty acid synthase